MRLEGQACTVIGGTMGIGRAVVERFAQEGADVVFLGRTEAAGREVEQACDAYAGSAVYWQADLGDHDRVAEAVHETVRRFGKLTTLVNVAAATGTSTGMGASVNLSREDWQRFLHDGLIGAVIVPVTTAIPYLEETAGSIVNISSDAAIRGTIGPPPYAAARGAQVSLTRHWAVELHKKNIRVNAVTIAFVDTGTKTIEGIKNDPVLFEIYSGMQLLGMGKPDDVAYAAIWLASPVESRWVTGAVIQVDGGASCYLPQLQLTDPRIRERRRSIQG